MAIVERGDQVVSPHLLWGGERRAALGLGALIALYGNGFSLLDSVTQLSLGGTVGGAGLGVAALVLAARERPTWAAELGLTRRGLGRGLAWGALWGCLIGLPGLVYFLLPDLMPVSVRYEPLRQSGLAVFLALIFIKIPFMTALAEELAFRGLLQARLRRAFGPLAGIWIGTLVFTAWHLVVSFTTLQGTTLAGEPVAAALAYLGQNLAVVVGGLIFALLRERTGSLAAPVVAHWLVDALMVTGLYLA